MSTPEQKADKAAQPADASQKVPACLASCDDSEVDKVGYKNPPKHTRFKPRNKFGKGRTRGSRNLKTVRRQHQWHRFEVVI